MKYTKKQNLYCDLVETTTLIFSFALAVFLGIFLVIINPNCKASFAETMAEDKIYCTYTLDDNFNDSCVMVVIDIYTSDINKNQDDLFLQLFSDNIIASIEDLSYIDCESTTKKYINNGDFRQILKLNLVERSKQNVLEVIEIVTEIDGVLWAGVDMVIEFDSLPHSADGSKYFYQWPLHWDYGVDIEPAWECTAGDSDIKVGIIDSGIEIHDDLSGNVADGWDFYNDNGVTTDDLTGHGTHIAGIIGATGNNLEGLVGVCQNIKLVPLQVTDDMGKPSSSVIVKAIQWAENNDLDILNYAKKYSTDFNLSDSLDKKVREYSKGMKQNLKIMKEVMHKPIILFLDEPFSGLDPTARIFLRKLLLRLKTQGISSLIISHDLDQIQKISDKITLIESGNTVFTKDVNELISTDEKIYIINICTFDELTKLKNIKDITILKATENIVTFSVNNEVFNIVKLLNENAINYSEIYQKKIYLEQYFER